MYIQQQQIYYSHSCRLLDWTKERNEKNTKIQNTIIQKYKIQEKKRSLSQKAEKNLAFRTFQKLIIVVF